MLHITRMDTGPFAAVTVSPRMPGKHPVGHVQPGFPGRRGAEPQPVERLVTGPSGGGDEQSHACRMFACAAKCLPDR